MKPEGIKRRGVGRGPRENLCDRVPARCARSSPWEKKGQKEETTARMVHSCNAGAHGVGARAHMRDSVTEEATKRGRRSQKKGPRSQGGRIRFVSRGHLLSMAEVGARPLRHKSHRANRRGGIDARKPRGNAVRGGVRRPLGPGGSGGGGERLTHNTAKSVSITPLHERDTC